MPIRQRLLLCRHRPPQALTPLTGSLSGRQTEPVNATALAESSEGAAAKPIVFVVHGRDLNARDQCVKVLARLGVDPVVLADQPGGRLEFVLDKFEKEAKQGDYAIVLFTPDDMAWCIAEGETSKDARPRPRQNVIFEFGYFVKSLKRKVMILYKKDPEKGPIELPSDVKGVVYEPFFKDVAEVEAKIKGALVDAGVLSKAS